MVQYPPPFPPKFLVFIRIAGFCAQPTEGVRLIGKILLGKGLHGIFWGWTGVIGGQMGKKARTNVTHHRSNHLTGMRVVSGCRLLVRQFSFILPDVVYGQARKTPSELVTDERDG